MIANFYKRTRTNNNLKTVLLISKNIEYIPHIKSIVLISGQEFCIYKIELDVDKCEYNIYLSRP